MEFEPKNYGCMYSGMSVRFDGQNKMLKKNNGYLSAKRSVKSGNKHYEYLHIAGVHSELIDGPLEIDEICEKALNEVEGQKSTGRKQSLEWRIKRCHTYSILVKTLEPAQPRAGYTSCSGALWAAISLMETGRATAAEHMLANMDLASSRENTTVKEVVHRIKDHHCALATVIAVWLSQSISKPHGLHRPALLGCGADGCQLAEISRDIPPR